MDFKSLLILKREIEEFRRFHSRSLNNYYIEGSAKEIGFRHTYNPQVDPNANKASTASTATCIVSLVDAGLWSGSDSWCNRTEEFLESLIEESDPKEWKSAGLEAGNPFTVGFKAEALHYLLSIDAEKGSNLHKRAKKVLAKAENLLVQCLLHKSPSDGDLTKADKFAEEGSANIGYYPPTAFLTHLVIRVLKKIDSAQLKKNANLVTKIKRWAWNRLEHEMAVVFGHRSVSDPYSLIYSALIFVLCTNKSEVTPVQNQLLAKAVDTFFDLQLQDGSWPLSRPLHHYPKFGNAYCFEYECLAQLLSEEALFDQIESNIEKLALATKRLNQIKVPLENSGYGWASGHHPSLIGAESWPTASVYHYLYKLDRTLADVIRKKVFEYVGEPYIVPPEHDEFAATFLDCPIYREDHQSHESLKETLKTSLVDPIKTRLEEIRKGNSLPSKVCISAIFYGPPGTSKTDLATHISKYLGWPLLKLDPSHLVREGLDQIQAETNRLFEMLCATERTVVLLDEFDEMVRDRAGDSEASSRFLTTAMLPKLASINKWRRLVFILATNFIEDFDIAIKRRGRFDLVLQIMPPTYDAKASHWPALKSIKPPPKYKDKPVQAMIESLTYAECDELVSRITNGSSKSKFENLKSLYANCTLKTHYQSKGVSQMDDPNLTWESVCEAQQTLIRIAG